MKRLQMCISGHVFVLLIVMLLAGCAAPTTNTGQGTAGSTTSTASTAGTAATSTATMASGTTSTTSDVTSAATTASTTNDVTSTATTASAASTTNDVTSTTSATNGATNTTSATSGDLLADVKASGKLRVTTDPNYKPQSFRNPDGSWEGFDIDTAREIAKRLGVQPEFMDINFDVITAGNWNGRWDVNIGSMTVTPDRAKVLLFTSPYYYAPAAFAVHKDSTVASIDALGGKKVGVGAATTYLDYLHGTLHLQGEQISKAAPKATAQVYDTDQLALADLALGNGTRLDAVLTALPTIQDAIKSGQPFKVLGDPVYYEDLAVALDQKSPKDSKSLQAEISRIVDDMHKDGTLMQLSKKYYGIDLTTKK